MFPGRNPRTPIPQGAASKHGRDAREGGEERGREETLRREGGGEKELEGTRNGRRGEGGEGEEGGRGKGGKCPLLKCPAYHRTSKKFWPPKKFLDPPLTTLNKTKQIKIIDNQLI